ncbi:NepR family anti-sigma factor [Microvirga yunnanensis]|uniref:NepR family anti-sigma factor n=2 Tax=Microvirga TaxID=186650 RepID=UPI0021CAB7A7|nr:NepR family anti-sigma factor [Microvirga sp. HBU65207]
MDQDSPMQKKNPNAMPHDIPEPIPGLRKSDSPALSPSVQAQIGQRLRQFYDALALGEQPVPDRFIEIINRLDGAKGEKQQS